jgi:O-antigen ligase
VTVAPFRSFRSRSFWPEAAVVLSVTTLCLVLAYLTATGHPSLAFAAVMAPLLGIVVLAHPWVGVAGGVTLMMVVPFTLYVGVPQLGVTRLASMAALGGAVLAARGVPQRAGLSVIDLALAGFVLFGLVSWQLGAHPPHSLRAAADFLTPVGLYVAARTLRRSHVTGLLWVFVVASSIAALTLYLEFFVTRSPLFVDPAAYLWAEGGRFIFRPAGVFEAPPAAGAILAMSAICAFALVRQSHGAYRVAAWGCAGVSIGGVVLTFTRSSMFGLLAGSLVYLVLIRPAKRARLLYGALGVALVITIVVVPRIEGMTWYRQGILRQGTFAQRQVYWSSALPIVANSPEHLMVGHGIDSLLIARGALSGAVAPDIANTSTLVEDSPHSQYIRTLIEEGVIGLGLLLAWLMGAALVGARSAWRSVHQRPILAAGTGAIVSTAIAAFATDSLRHPPTFGVLALLTGLVINLSRQDASPPDFPLEA